jgi:hypothetical protein
VLKIISKQRVRNSSILRAYGKEYRGKSMRFVTITKERKVHTCGWTSTQRSEQGVRRQQGLMNQRNGTVQNAFFQNVLMK